MCQVTKLGWLEKMWTYGVVSKVVKFFDHDLFEYIQVRDHNLWLSSYIEPVINEIMLVDHVPIGHSASLTLQLIHTSL